jgi:hypothetical protein
VLDHEDDRAGALAELLPLRVIELRDLDAPVGPPCRSPDRAGCP